MYVYTCTSCMMCCLVEERHPIYSASACDAVHELVKTNTGVSVYNYV